MSLIAKFQFTEHQKHLTWSTMMMEYVDKFPKLSIELEHLKEHKKELEVSIHYGYVV